METMDFYQDAQDYWHEKPLNQNKVLVCIKQNLKQFKNLTAEATEADNKFVITCDDIKVWLIVRNLTDPFSLPTWQIKRLPWSITEHRRITEKLGSLTMTEFIEHKIIQTVLRQLIINDLQGKFHNKDAKEN